MMKKYYLPLAALSLLGMANVAHAARDDSRYPNGARNDSRHPPVDERCLPEPPAMCYPDECVQCYCLGPENYGVNAPVCPRTCDGDLFIEVAGFYWNAHQDGMEYALDNSITNPGPNPGTSDIQELNAIVDARYLNPKFKWDFGFKLGVGYCSACDGWDVGVLWTWYKTRAKSHVEAEADDHHTLLPLWSAFAPFQGSVLYATDIETFWNLKMNLVDIELGRNFWTSKYLAIRPHIGLRVALIDQHYKINNKGGSWSGNTATPSQAEALTNEVNIDNDYKSVGLRGGLDTTWNFGCGWALYGNMAASILYGRFDVEHDEWNRLASTPHDKTKILETEESFRASRGALDLGLGIQWTGLFCDCKYGFTFALGWEHHLFFNLNQMWRVNRIGDTLETGADLARNNTGENVFHQRRGDLDTQGWTLSVKFEY